MTAADSLAAALSDRYAIERELGQGGMATVYLARDLRHERHGAVKVLRPELAASLGSERAGGPARLAVRFDDPTRSWHQNGFRIHDGKFYFTLGDRQSDVWMTELAGSR